MFTQKLNNDEYKVLYCIYRDNVLTDGTYNVFVEETLDPLNLESFYFVSDCIEPYLVGEMVYRDTFFTKFSKLQNSGDLYLRVEIKRNSSDILDQPFIHNFFINSMDMIEKDETGCKYKLKLTSILWKKFNSNIQYSSLVSNNSNISYTSILRGLLKTAEFDVEDTLVHCKNKGYYITESNASLIVSLHEVLKKTISKESGLFFIKYKFLQNKYDIVSLNQMYTNINENLSVVDFINFPTASFELPTQQYKMSTISTHKYNTVEKSMNILRKNVFNNFDIKTRRFIQEKYNISEIKETIPRTQRENFNKVLVDNKDVYYNKNNEYSYYSKIRDFFLYDNVIEFKTYGQLNRYSANFLNVVIDPNDMLYKKFSGVWFVKRIFHMFYRNEYINHVFLCRADSAIEEV